MLWQSHLPWLGTLLLLVFVRAQVAPNSLTSAMPLIQARNVKGRTGGDAIAELEIGPHSNPLSLVKIFNPDALRARTALAPAITLELKGMRLLLRTNEGTIKKVGS
ncbi:uncharacterized protein LOC111079723 [Drosophila obscura]|uniref:uncharacterized protein LOC111079723 n=1 Tax=Drosophila obscura TaxID=7282 RepID=UPI001BB2CA9E|nr:uncharacterized protein LOC111079723 [Drosophila obscura]